VSDRKTTVQLSVELVTCAVPVVAERGAVLLVLDGVVIGVQQGKTLGVSHAAMDQVIERQWHKPAPSHDGKLPKHLRGVPPAPTRIKDTIPALHEGVRVYVPTMYRHLIASNGTIRAMPEDMWVDKEGVVRRKRPFMRRVKRLAERYEPRPYANVDEVAFRIIDMLDERKGVIDSPTVRMQLGLVKTKHDWMYRDALQRMMKLGLVEKVGNERYHYSIRVVDWERLRKMRNDIAKAHDPVPEAEASE
jgi:hypothetical protein